MRFCGYYKFITNYSAMVCPLTDLTKGYPPEQKSTKAKDSQSYQSSEHFGE